MRLRKEHYVQQMLSVPKGRSAIAKQRRKAILAEPQLQLTEAQIKQIDEECAAGEGRHRFYLYHLLPADRYRVNAVDAERDCEQKAYKKRSRRRNLQEWITPDPSDRNNSSTVRTADEAST
eukprot:SAG31_NODE_464_length_15318_cov_17.930876_14_plen_121_part_00